MPPSPAAAAHHRGRLAGPTSAGVPADDDLRYADARYSLRAAISADDVEKLASSLAELLAPSGGVHG